MRSEKQFNDTFASSENEIERIIRDHWIIITGNYTVNDDGSIDVLGNVVFPAKSSYLKELPLKFNKVSGDFSCRTLSLRSLKNSPNFVGGSFDCSDNLLKSLIGAPECVGNNFSCHENSLITLEGCPIEVPGMFNCALNKLESLEYSPQRVGQNFYAHHNRLSTLRGSPKYVGGSCNVAVNLLNDLEGCPDYIGLNFHFDKWLPSLYMGEKNCCVGGVKIESLGRINNDYNKCLPEVVLRNQKCLPVVFKYNTYLQIFDKEGQIKNNELNDILFEIQDGML